MQKYNFRQMTQADINVWSVCTLYIIYHIALLFLQFSDKVSKTMLYNREIINFQNSLNILQEEKKIWQQTS